MSDADIIEARRLREEAIIRAAYDYALAAQGCSRDGKSISIHCKSEHKEMADYALSRLEHEARMLAASLLVDAQLHPTADVDRRTMPEPSQRTEGEAAP